MGHSPAGAAGCVVIGSDLIGTAGFVPACQVGVYNVIGSYPIPDVGSLSGRCEQVGEWCYCFNIPDVFTRRWSAYHFSPLATADIAVESLVETVTTAKPDCSVLTIQYDNGSQYTGKSFRKTASNLGIKIKFIWKSTRRPNDHMEAFHGSLKQEFIRPHDLANYQEAEAIIAEAFRDCNQAKLHSVLKYVPPEEFSCIVGGGAEMRISVCVKLCRNRSQNLGSRPAG